MADIRKDYITMTREQAKQLLPIIQAFAEGKTIEYRKDPSDDWGSLTSYNFNDPLGCYRIKPEPKLRPWTKQEVPLGCWVRYRGGDATEILARVNCKGCGIFGASMAFSFMLEYYEHSTDQGKTWLPCGVVE